MPIIMDQHLPVLSILGYWAILLGTVGGPGLYRLPDFVGNSIKSPLCAACLEPRLEGSLGGLGCCACVMTGSAILAVKRGF